VGGTITGVRTVGCVKGKRNQTFEAEQIHARNDESSIVSAWPDCRHTRRIVSPTGTNHRLVSRQSAPGRVRILDLEIMLVITNQIWIVFCQAAAKAGALKR
jgi:hypothetical protein